MVHGRNWATFACVAKSESIDWNPARNWNNSELDVVFINRPAEGNQRGKYHP
jgi:hypothetical protein